MYAMSWEVDNRDYKYESIQHGYEVVDFDEYESDSDEISLDALMENEEMELELLEEME